MKKILILFIFLSTFSFSNELILKERFIYTNKYQANLIYKIKPNSKKAVLYIHGFNDYFFNKEFASNFLNQGYSFFAIDLHNHGKNMTKKTKRYYFKDIKEFYPEINRAIDIMENKYKIENITLYGISQGALVAALFENDNERVDKLILDSPFFDFHFNWAMENLALPVVAQLGEFFPEFALKSDDENVFGKTLHKDFDGEWDIDMNLKAITKNAPIYLGWINAVYKAQQRLQNGLDIRVPSLILYSDKSTSEKANKRYLHNTDIVLDVKDMKHYSDMLSMDKSLVTKEEVTNAMHGILISPKEVRQDAYNRMFKWLNDSLY